MIVLRLAKPFSTNAMYRSYGRNGRLTTIKSKAYRDWQAQTIGLIHTQKWTPVLGSYALRITLPASNRFDLDNTLKAQLDTLRHAGVVVDDSPKYLKRLTIEQGEEAFTKVVITPLGGENGLERGEAQAAGETETARHDEPHGGA